MHTRQTFGSAGLLTVILGAVIFGCALLVPAIGAATTINVEIIKPTTAPTFTFDTGVEYDFEAVAFVEGEELPGGEVSWEWDFGDGTLPHVTDNPCEHTYLNSGNFTVKVTARYGALTGEDTINAAAAPAGLLAAVEFFAYPDNGARVCDLAEVLWRVPAEDVFANGVFIGDVRIYSRIGEEWQEASTWCGFREMEEGKWYYVVSTVWDTCFDPNTEAVDWRVDYTFLVEEPPPPGQEGPYYAAVSDSKAESWTPYNTVLTGAEECLIKHSVGETSHTVEFTTDHLVNVEQGTDPKYQVVLTVYDLGGNQVDQVTKDDVALGPGSITWEPEFAQGGWPPGQPQDANSVYAYRIDADHPAQCGDSGNVGAISSASVSDFTWTDLPDEACVTLSYALGQSLSPCDLSLYKNDLSDGSIQAIKGMDGEVLEGLPSTAGQHQVKVRFAVDRHVMGNYHFVVDGTQADGSANRDLSCKPAVPRGAVQVIWPPASVLPGEGWPLAGMGGIMDALGGMDERTKTHYAPVARCPTASQAVESMQRDAITLVFGHGVPWQMWLGGMDTTQHLLRDCIRQPGQEDDPVNDIYYLSEQTPGFGCSAFTMFVGCHTWNADYTEPPYPDGLIVQCGRQGAGGVAGFRDYLYACPAECFLRYFFTYTMTGGDTIGAAYEHAVDDVIRECGGWTGGVTSFMATHPDASLKPAQWGGGVSQF